VRPKLYRRARTYALRVLESDEAFAQGLHGDVASFKQALSRLGDDDVPAVFWAAFGWGSSINISRTDPEAIADLPRVNAMMEFVALRNRAYYYCGALVYLATMNAVTPVMLGGNPERAKVLFDEALATTQGKFLMIHVYYARSYAMQALDQELFQPAFSTRFDRASLEVLRAPDCQMRSRKKRLVG